MLEGLIERIERATPESAEREELGVAINEALGIASYITDDGDPTQSLDAAMTLVPEGWRVSRIEEHWSTGRWIAQLSERPTEGQIKAFDDGLTIGWNTADTKPDAATPALALCAASLRARLSS